MQRQTTSVRVLALVAAGLALTNASCVEWIGDQGILIIEGAEPAQIAGCDTQNGITGDLGNGVLDLLTEVPYEAYLRVIVNVPATFNTQTLGQERQRQPSYPFYGDTDTNVVIVDGVEVFFTNGTDGTALTDAGQLPTIGNPRISPASGVIYNTQQTLNAEDRFFATAITSEEAQILANGRIGTNVSATTRERIIANIRFIGNTTGGGFVRSSLFQYPIDLCRGCLFPPEALPTGQCPAGTTLTAPFCSPPGQDTAVACQ